MVTPKYPDEKYYFFSMLEKKISVREFSANGLRTFTYDIQELEEPLRSDGLGFRFSTTLVPEEGLTYPQIPSPTLKLYEYQDKFYLTVNSKRLPTSTLLITLDVANNSYKFDRIDVTDFGSANILQTNSFFHKGKLFLLASNEKAANLQVIDIENGFKSLQQYRMNLLEPFPFKNSTITKAKLNIIGSDGTEINNDRKVKHLMEQMYLSYPNIVVGEYGKDTLALILGSYNVHAYNSSTTNIGYKLKTTYFQCLLDADSFKILDEFFIESHRKIRGITALSLMGSLNTSSLKGLKKVNKYKEYIDRHIWKMKYKKPLFYPRVDLKVIIDEQLYYGYYRKDLKEIQILKL